MTRTKSTVRSLMLGAGLVIVGLTPVLASDSWPGWGGPHQSLRVEASLGLAEAPAVDLELVWRRPFGSGYASVTVVDGIAVSAAAAVDGDVLEAFDPATGRVRWRLRLGPRFLGRSGSDDGPLATPAVADGVVYMVHAAGAVVAADLRDGAERWRRDLVATLGAQPPLYGFSVSPLVAGGVVVVPVGKAGETMLAGLDTVTGAVRWTAGTDTVGYQNPVLVRLAGGEQVVFPGDEHVWGLDPADGRVLWRHALDARSDTGLAVPVDAGRMLFTDSGDTTFMLAVERADGDGYAVRRLWQERVLKNNHCQPIFHDGVLYGFDGRFLSAVRAADGTLVWKSRPPGGQAVTMVDGHLFLWDNRGALVAVEAATDGYREKGRLQLAAAARVFTPPTFAAGLLLLRDLDSLYAVRPRPSRGAAEPEPVDAPAAGDAVDGFLRALEAAPAAERAARIDRFLATHPQLPIVTPAGRVHFLFRGEVPDLAIQGDMIGRFREEPMRRVAGTDLHHRAFDLPLDERWEYRFKVFEASELDPANPERVDGPDGAFSVVAGPRWQPPAVDAAPAAGDRGRLESVLVTDPSNDRSYAFSVFTPAGYDPAADRRYPLVLFARGADAIEHGEAVALLDRRAGEGFAPLIAVFLELPESAWWDQNRARFAEVMDRLVMPRIEEGWRVATDPGGRAMIARAWSSETTMLWVLGGSPRIGKLALQSPHYGRTFLDRHLAPLLAGEPGEALYVDWGAFDVRNPAWPADVAIDAPALADRFRAAGWPVTAAEGGGGHNWTSWRARLESLLGTLFPAD